MYRLNMHCATPPPKKRHAFPSQNISIVFIDVAVNVHNIDICFLQTCCLSLCFSVTSCCMENKELLENKHDVF